MNGPGSGARRQPASQRALWPVFFGLASAIVVVDQLTKAWIVANFEVSRSVDIVGEAVRITLSHNTGALFGLFRDQAPLFAISSVAVIGLIVWYHARSGRSLLTSIALGLLLGGALGNLADRARFGYVVDFVDAGIGGWRWYTFNVADSAISISILLLLVMAIWPGLAGSAHDG